MLVLSRYPVIVFLTAFLQLVEAQDSNVAASTGHPMQLTAPFIAQTPASLLKTTASGGVNITNVTRNPLPQPEPGKDLTIQTKTTGSPSAVALHYLINFGPESTIPMTSNTDGQFTAAIPSSAFKSGDMIRWFITAGAGGTPNARSPALTSADRYYGTVIASPNITYHIPVMDWFTNDVTSSTAKTGANGSAVYFLGRFYDNLFVRRKGVTSLSWPKPKLKFKLADNHFIYKQTLGPSESKVDTFDLNSLYYEPGQKSYMREAIAYQVLQDVGAVAATNFFIVLRLNGAFYGLYTYTENDDKYYLGRNGLSEKGLLVKPTSGSSGNLGFAVTQDQLPYSYQQQSQKNTRSAWPDLYKFTQGIAGNGPTVRSKFVYDSVELSETINTMAVLTMLLTQDRCTKNYLLYLDPNTTKWQMFAYDLKSALNSDAGFGGVAASDYCTLQCPQWNSPLYCDRFHPQDVTTNTTTPWAYIQASSIGRRLQQDGVAPSGMTSSAAFLDNGPNGPNVNITNPDQNLASAGISSSGPSGTFNYLIDLITQVPSTRQMYMRRLRSLTDQYYPTGRLTSMVTDTYNLIKSVADEDNTKWGIGDITLGYKSLTQEQIPIRQKQLLDVYGPSGTPALLPASQPSQPAVTIGRIDFTSVQNARFVEIVNPLTYAVDVSSWKLSGAATARFKPGTVIATGNSLIVAADSAGYRSRSSTTAMTGSAQVISGLENVSSGGTVQLQDNTGATITSKVASFSGSPG